MSDNVIGPIPLSDWHVLKFLNGDIRWRKMFPPDIALAKEMKIFSNLLKKYLTKENSTV